MASCPGMTCGNTTCGDGATCCDDTCCLPNGTTCRPEACQGGTGGMIPCAEQTCDGATETCCTAEGCTTCIAMGANFSAQQCD